MLRFCAVIEEFALRDSGYSGTWYTWEHGLAIETRICERLDHFICSGTLLDLFPDTYVNHLLCYKSNHTFILTKINHAAQTINKEAWVQIWNIMALKREL